MGLQSQVPGRHLPSLVRTSVGEPKNLNHDTLCFCHHEQRVDELGGFPNPHPKVLTEPRPSKHSCRLRTIGRRRWVGDPG